jgi:hypothetical protein
MIPVWPHEKFAALCACDVWAGYVPKVIELDAWIERWIPGMMRDKRWVVVFPTPQNRGVAVDPTRISDDLQNELTNYE